MYIRTLENFVFVAKNGSIKTTEKFLFHSIWKLFHGSTVSEIVYVWRFVKNSASIDTNKEDRLGDITAFFL